jgi:hypothetical protein
MYVENRLLPDEQQIRGFLEPGAGGAIYMVNLLKFRPKAEYADGRESGLTGREAYMLYAEGVQVLLEQVGGTVGFMADVERLAIGEVEDLWDEVAIAQYPSRAAMLEMMQLPAMAEISVHREAGLAGQLNIETVAAAGSWLDPNGN